MKNLSSQKASVVVPDKTFGLEDVKQHKTEKSCWIIVHGNVYDVTEFLEEHPGGYDIILAVTGKDATQDFDEIGHSNSAKALLAKYVIGRYEGGDAVPIQTTTDKEPSRVPAVQMSVTTRALRVLLPLLILLIAMALSLYSKETS